MESYLLKTKPSIDCGDSGATKVKKKPPQQCHLEGRSASTTTSSSSSSVGNLNPLAGGVKASSEALLKALGTDESAITNSTAYERTLHIQSVTSGHQSGGRGSGRWILHRNAKLAAQAPDAKSELFKGLVFYINGFTGKSITNLQLKMLIYENGGMMKLVETSAVTHAFVSNLSGSKLHRVLNKKFNKIKYVTPQWAIESVRKGKRLREVDFAAPIFAETQGSVLEHYTFDDDGSTMTLEENDDDCEEEAGTEAKSPKKKMKPKRSLNHPATFETYHDLPPPSAAPTEPLPRLPPPKQEKKEEEVETIVLLSSSPLAIEERSPSVDENEEESDEEDESGMPPSAQKCK